MKNNDEFIHLEQDYEYFKQEFEKLSGIQLNLYKEKQMKRRINTLIARKGLGGYASFISRLKVDSVELDSFVDYITINVTEFFRTPEHWQYIEEEIFPKLLNQNKGKLKIWSCAGSTGEEAYSLAMSLCQLTDPSHFSILATDLDEKVIQIAQIGSYDEKSIEKLPEEILERYFVKDGSHRIICDEVKACVEFKKLDLLKDEYPMDCDLIVCRNVLIYFTEEAKEQIYTKFKESLKSEGYLFTGNTEQIIYYKKFGFKKIKNYLYQNDWKGNEHHES